MRTIKKIIKKTIGVLFLVLLIIGGVIGYKGYERYKEVLEKVPLQEKIAEIRQKPSYTEIEDLPQIYLDAVVAVEDKRFYHHPGIDPISIARAVRNDIRARALIEGGSTITQQLAKNLYFGQEQSLNRKVAEGMLALKLEWNYTKEEILELYVNSIYFGDGYYCVEEASYGYFGKPPSEMACRNPERTVRLRTDGQYGIGGGTAEKSIGEHGKRKISDRGRGFGDSKLQGLFLLHRELRPMQ